MITYYSADRWFQRRDTYRNDGPAHLGVIRVGGTYRLTPQPTHQATWTVPPEPPDVSTVRPGDLTGLGITVDEYLRSWDDRRREANLRQLCVCFDSVTTLLQYAEVDTALRFLHTLNSQLQTAETASHFHLDPGAHDSQTVDALSALFDIVIEDTDDGWTVKGP